MIMREGVCPSLMSEVYTCVMCDECVMGCEENVMSVTAEALILNRQWRLGIALAAIPGMVERNVDRKTLLLWC